MKISLNDLKAPIFLILVLILLIWRYINIGIDKQDILFFSLYYLVGTLSLFFSLVRFKVAINPISIYVIFVFLLSYSFIRLSDKQIPYSFSTHLIIDLSLLTYLLFASFKYSSRPFNFLKLDNGLKRGLLYLITIFSFITFLIECALFGYLPVLNIGSSDVYIETNAKLVPFLHYFIVLLAFIPSWAYILYKEKILSKKEFRWLLFVSIFILINYLSRQLYLLLGITFFMSYTYYNVLKSKVLIRIGILIVVLFMLVGYLKFNSELAISFSEFSRLAAGIENENVNILESTFTEYSSKRYSALDEMVRYRDDIGYLGLGTYTFRPFLSFFLLEKSGIITRIPELDSERKVGTFLVDPYLDFGLIGVVLLNILYAFLASRYFQQYNERYPEAIIKFSIIIFCLLMGMFINYFNTMLIWLGIVFNKLLIGGLLKKNKD